MPLDPKKLRDAIARAGTTPSALAAAIGKPKSSVCRLVTDDKPTGVHNVKVDFAAAMARKLGVRVDKLLADDR